MSKARLFAFPLLLCALWPAQAQQGAPVLFGRADFEMEWKVEPLKLVLSARYLAARRIMRLEILDGTSRVILRDLGTGEAQLLIAQGQKGAYSFKAAPMGRFTPGPPTGSQTIGNEECREFSSGPASLCLTDDGIPLKMTFPEGSLTASRLLRQPQLPAMFELPAGVQAKPLPAGVQPPPLPF
jgi:hypothetical protein